MSGFIEVELHGPYEYGATLMSLDAIKLVTHCNGDDSRSVIETYDESYSKAPSYVVTEPYESLKARILAASTAKEEKRNLPPTPPIKSKEEGTHTDTPPARACEGNLTCEGFRIPTLDEVAAYISANGFSVDAETFWNHYNSIGWKVGKSPIRCWQSVCRVWERTNKRQTRKEAAQLAHFDAKADEREAKRTAHIDAKMDERERKRERRMGGRRKADNNVEMTDEVREEVRRDFSF